MNTSDKKKRSQFIVLLVLILGTAGYWAYTTYFAAASEAVDKTAAINLPGSGTGDGRIRLDLMNADDERGAGGRNLFGFGAAPPLALPAPMVFIPPPPPVVQPTVTRVVQPTVQQAPNIPLKFNGFAKDLSTGRMTAVIESQNPAGRFNLSEGDFLMGRFLVTKITETAVDVEDLERPENNRKNTIKITP